MAMSYDECRAALVAAFPACFAAKGQPKRPLAIGIHRAAVDRGVPGLSASQIRRTISEYCRGLRYALAMEAGGPRYDLDGNPAGDVREIDQQVYSMTQRGRERYEVMRTALAEIAKTDPSAVITEGNDTRYYLTRAAQAALDKVAAL